MYLLKELVRLSSQHRTLYCYTILSIWIFLLVAGKFTRISSLNTHSHTHSTHPPHAGMYKYIVVNSPQQKHAAMVYMRNHPEEFIDASSPNKPRFVQPADSNQKLAETYSADCNPVDEIVRKDDGGVLEGWHLQGVLLLTRHGDRGPMAHVRGIQAVDCGHENMAAINKYKTFLANSSAASGTAGMPAGHITWTKMGPFHGNPLLPSFEKSCLLGQLTYKYIHNFAKKY